MIKSSLARFSDIFALGTPSNIHGTAISYRCAKFGAFVNSVTILTLRDLTIRTDLSEAGPSSVVENPPMSSDVSHCKLLYHITGLGIQNCSETLFIKKKRKEKNEFLSVCNKVGCRMVFTHPQK